MSNLPGIGVPPPAQLANPSNPPGSQTRGTDMVIVQSVDNASLPKYANVLVDDKTPSEAGYSIPLGWGPWTVGGISTTSTTAVSPGSVTVTPASMSGLAVGHTIQCVNSDKTNPEYVTITAVTSTTFTATFSSAKSGTWDINSGGFCYNNSNGIGGSIVLADLDSRTIIGGPYGTSNIPPTPYYAAIGDHKHDGNLNPSGFQNPNPIDIGQLKIGALNITPNITNIGTLTTSPVGSATTDFTVTSFQVDSVGTTGTSKWLAAIYCIASVHSQNQWGVYGVITPNSSGTYTGTWGGLGSGNKTYDIGIVYVDLVGNLSNVGVIDSNIAPNTLWGSTPIIIGAPTFNDSGLTVTYQATSPNNYNINLSFVTNAPQYCVKAMLYITNHGSSTPLQYVSCPITGTGTGSANNNINATFTNLPDGTQTYDIYGFYVATDGETTTPGNIYTTSAFTAPLPGSGGAMPSNTTPSVSNIALVNLNGWTQTAELSFNLSTAQTTALWLHDVELIYRTSGGTFCPYGTTVNVGGTSLTVYWPFSSIQGNPSVGSTITLEGYNSSWVWHTENVTVSAIGTPTTDSNGYSINTLTISATVNQYVNPNVNYSNATWVSTGTFLPQNTGGTYTGVWSGIPSNSDLGIRLVDYTGGVSNPSIAIWTQAHWLHTLNKSIGDGAMGTVPNFSAGALTYTNVGNGAYDAQSAVTFDAVATTNNPWLLDLEIVTSAATYTTTLSANATSGTNTCTVTSAANLAVNQEIIVGSGTTLEHNTITGISGTTITVLNNWNSTKTSGAAVSANLWQHYGFVAPNTNGSSVYTLDWISLGAGTSYVLGVRYIDVNGGRSWVGNIGTTAANPIVTNNNNQPAMPNGATFTVSGVTTSTYDSGLHTLLTGANARWIPSLAVNFTLGDANSPDTTHWASMWAVYLRQHTTNTPTDKTTYERTTYKGPAASLWGNNSGQSVLCGRVTPGENYDVGLAIIDGQGNETPLVQVVSNVAIGTTNLPHCPFPGGYVNQDGSWSNVDGASSTQTFSFTSGQVFHASCKIAKGSSTGNAWLVLGNGTNGYGLQFDNGQCGIWKFVAGVATQIGTAVANYTTDTAYHSYRLTITPGATNDIEANLDGNQFTATDSSVTLTSGTWPVTLITAGSNGKVLEYNAIATQQHFGGLPPVIHSTHIPPWQTLPGDNVPLQSNLFTARHFKGGNSNDTGNMVDGNSDLLHTRHSPGVQAALNSSGQLLLTEFPSALINSDGSLSNVHGKTSTQTYHLIAGQPFTVSCDIAPGTTGDVEVVIGNATNGYSAWWDTSGNLHILKYVSGVQTSLVSTGIGAQDTNYHSFRISVVNGSSSNSIEVSVDGHSLSTTDSSLNLNGYAVTLYTGNSSGKVLHFAASVAPQHFGTQPANIQNTLYAPWQTIPSDNSPIQSGLLTWRHLKGESGSDTGALGDGAGHIIHTRHSTAVQTVIDSSSNLYNNELPLLPKNTSGFFILPTGADPVYPSASGLYFGAGSDSGLYAQFRVKVNTTGKAPGYAFGFQFGFTYGGSPGSYTKTSGYEVQITTNASGQTTIALYKWTSGSSVQVYNYTIGLGFGDGNLHTVRVWAGVVGSGLQIALSFDGVVGTYTDPSSYYGSGQFGFANNNTDSAYSIADLSVQVSAHLHGAMSSAVKSRILSDSTLHVDSGVGPVSGYLPYANHDLSLQHGVFQKNLVVNGNNSNGTGAVAPGSYGWTGTFGSTTGISSAGVYGPYGSVSMIQVQSNPNGGYWQDVPCTPNTTYTFCAVVEADTANADPGIWIGTADGNWNQWNGASGTPVGSLGTFYTQSTSQQINSWLYSNGATTGAQVCLYGTFTTPNGIGAGGTTPFNKMRVMLYNGNNIGVALTCKYIGVMVIEGNRLQDYIDHEPNANGIHIDRHIVDGTYARTLASALTNGQVDLAKAGVINRLTANITESTGLYFAAEHGADITGNHTSNDTSHVNSVAAATISQGAGRANAAINSSNEVNYANMSTEYQGNFDSSGNMKASKALISKVPNSTAWYTDFTIQTNTTGVSGTATTKWWFDNGFGNSVTFRIPSYTSTVGDQNIVPGTNGNAGVGATTSTNPSGTFTNVTWGDTFYFLVYYSPVNGWSFTTSKNSAFTQAQIQAAFADSNGFAVIATTTASGSVSIGGTGNTSVSAGGGSGGRPMK